MNDILAYYTKHAGKPLHTVFRIIVGILFFMHGLSKFYNPGEKSTALISLLGLAGVIEIIGGILILVGLFTRIAALVSGVEMIVAYIMMHAPQGINPLHNSGEGALLYLAAFLVLLTHGAGSWSIDQKMMK